MPLATSALLTIGGLVLWIASFIVVMRANPADRIPFWGNPPRVPGRAYGMRALAILPVGFGATMMGIHVSGTPIAPIAVLFALGLPLLLVPVHNRRVARSDRPTDPR